MLLISHVFVDCRSKLFDFAQKPSSGDFVNQYIITPSIIDALSENDYCEAPGSLLIIIDISIGWGGKKPPLPVQGVRYTIDRSPPFLNCMFFMFEVKWEDVLLHSKWREEYFEEMYELVELISNYSCTKTLFALALLRGYYSLQVTRLKDHPVLW